MTSPCRSWRIRRWRIVRCSWSVDHVLISKYHHADGGWIWPVSDRERSRGREFPCA